MTEIPVKEILRRTEGWLELGCPDEALKQLEELPDVMHVTREVLKLKCRAVEASADWQELFALSDCCLRYFPREMFFQTERRFAEQKLQQPEHASSSAL